MARLVPLLAVVLLLGAGGAAVGVSLGSHAVPGPAPASHGPDRLPGASPAPVCTAISPRPADGGEGRLLVSTSDAQAVPNTGLRANFTAFPTFGLAPSSSFQVSVTETIGGYDAVFGLFENDVTFPVAFYSIFDNATDATVRLAYWTDLLLAAGSSYDFALTEAPGTTAWTLTVDGALFDANASEATFDFGAGASTWLGGIGFSEVAFYASESPVPDVVTVPLAFAVRTGAGWYLPENASARWVATTSTWGVEGRAQNGSLAPGELLSGTAVPTAADGATLWRGGPVGVTVTVVPSAPAVLGTSAVSIGARVTDSAGVPLPGVAVAFADRLGSDFEPNATTSDASGTVSSSLGAPNVSAPTADQVVVTVTLFGFRGNGSTPLTVDPAIAVTLLVVPMPVSGTVGAPIDFAITASDPTNAPVPGLLLFVTISGGSAEFAPFGTTGATGELPIELIAADAGTFHVSVRVSSPGYWGGVAVDVPVRAAPPTLLSTVAPYAIGAGLGGAAVAAAMILLRRHRRRPGIPRFDLPEERPGPGEERTRDASAVRGPE